MGDYSGNQQLCATCEYWAGQREIDMFSSWVKNCGGTGRCAHPNGLMKTMQRLPNTCACLDYKKWSLLK